MGGERTDLTALALFRLARKGDPLATALFERAGKYLGMGLATLVNLFNPEAVILGGGLAGAWDFLVPAAEREMKKRAFSFPAERVQLRKAALGDDAGVLGAAWTCLQKIEERRE
jgi:glucokinase